MKKVLFILKKRQIYTNTSYSTTSSGLFNSANFVNEMLLSNCIDMTRPMRNTIDPPMNAIQMRVAKSICDEYGITLHKAINDKMWW